MLEHLINQYLPTLIHLLETMGIIVLAVGAFDGFYCYLKGLLHNNFTNTRILNDICGRMYFKIGTIITITAIDPITYNNSNAISENENILCEYSFSLRAYASCRDRKSVV